MNARTRSLTLTYAPYVALLVALLLVYSSVIVAHYGVFDDYTFFRAPFLRVFDRQVAAGRPITGLLFGIVFSRMSTIDYLQFVRLLGVLFLGVLSWTLYRGLTATRLLPIQAICLSLIICLLPQFQVFVAVTSNFLFALTCAIAGLSAVNLWLVKRQSSPKLLWIHLGLSASLLLVALLMFQPAAMFFWVFAIMDIHRHSRSTLSKLYRLALYLGIFILVIGLDFGSLRISGILTATRSTLVSPFEIVAKIEWFITEPLRNALNFDYFPASTPIAIVVGIIIFFGLWQFFAGGLRGKFISLTISALALTMSYLPNILVAENWPSYRTQGALGALLVLYSFYALQGYVRLLSQWLSWQKLKQLLVLGPLAVLVGASLTAAYEVNTYYVLPQVVELQYMKSQLTSANLGQNSRILILLARWQEGDHIAPLWLYDEFGAPSSYAPGAAESMVRLLLQEKGISDAKFQIATFGRAGMPNVFFDTTIIDMRKIRDFR